MMVCFSIIEVVDGCSKTHCILYVSLSLVYPVKNYIYIPKMICVTRKSNCVKNLVYDFSSYRIKCRAISLNNGSTTPQLLAASIRFIFALNSASEY